MTEPRRYDEAETSRILRRAMELRAPVPARVGELARGEGITLDQLVEAAAEAGMEVDAVRRAAAELEAPEALRVSAFYGAPLRIVEERRVRRIVDPSEFDAFVDEVRRGFGIVGSAAVTARSVTWSAAPLGTAIAQGRLLTVSLVVREGGTILRVEEDLSSETVLVGVGAMVGLIGAVLGGGIALSVAPPLALLAPLIPASLWGGARGLFRREHTKRRDELIRVADRLAALTEEPIR